MNKARLYTILPSSYAVAEAPRYAGSANPTGNTLDPTRETAPLKSSNPRVQHPKLNKTSWSLAYAVSRAPAKTRRGTRRKRYNEGVA